MKKTLKRVLALALTVVMLVSCWVFVTPTQTTAATAGSYKARIYTYHPDANRGMTNSATTLKIYYKTNNGTSGGSASANRADNYNVTINESCGSASNSKTVSITTFDYKVTFYDEDGSTVLKSTQTINTMAVQLHRVIRPRLMTVQSTMLLTSGQVTAIAHLQQVRKQKQLQRLIPEPHIQQVIIQAVPRLQPVTPKNARAVHIHKAWIRFHFRMTTTSLTSVSSIRRLTLLIITLTTLQLKV